jgi:hypothetical protein
MRVTIIEDDNAVTVDGGAAAAFSTETVRTEFYKPSSSMREGRSLALANLAAGAQPGGLFLALCDDKR